MLDHAFASRPRRSNFARRSKRATRISFSERNVVLSGTKGDSA